MLDKQYLKSLIIKYPAAIIHNGSGTLFITTQYETDIPVKNKNNNTFVDNILPSKDDEWINYKINLSKTFCDNRVSPYRLTFTGISNTQKIYIKNYN